MSAHDQITDTGGQQDQLQGIDCFVVRRTGWIINKGWTLLLIGKTRMIRRSGQITDHAKCVAYWKESVISCHEYV